MKTFLRQERPDGDLLRGNRVIIPEVGRSKMLDQICRINTLASGYIWWPKMDNESL